MHRARAWFALAVLTGCVSAPRIDEPGPLPAAGPTAQAPAVPSPPIGRLPTTARPTAYALELVVDPTSEGFVGVAEISFELAEPSRWLWLHAKDLTIDRATLADETGELASHPFAEPGLLAVDLGRDLPAGAHAIKLAYHAKYGGGLSGLYKVEVGADAYAFTQFEALDARRAFPCFDEPGFKTPFDVSVVAKASDRVVGNTQPKSEEKLDGGMKRVRFARTEKLPTYLVALAVGPLDIVDAPAIPASEARKTAIPLRGVAPRGQGKKLAYALGEADDVILELERYFGVAYPYDKLDLLAVPDFAAGAMENAGAVTFQEGLLLVDPTSGTEPQRRDVTAVMAHELAHQWFGNLVTMEWWDDLWLNEAFATWMGQRTVERLHPGWETELETLASMHSAMDSDSLASARAIRQPIEGEDDVENAFDDLTYEKGGGLIAMYERFYGEERFRAGVRRYLAKHRFGSATTEDFLADVFEGAAPEVAQSFLGFLNGPGVPAVSLGACATGSPAKVSVEVDRWLPLGSTAARKLGGGVPLCVRSKGGASSCKLAPVGKSELELGAKCPKWVFPNADGAAYARWTPSRGDVDALLSGAWADLSAREKMAAVDAMRAGLRAGTLEADANLSALPKIAGDRARSVAFAPIDDLRFLRSYVVPVESRPKLERAIRDVYGPLFAKAGWTAKPAPTDTPVLRHDALEAAALLGRDPKLRAEALRRARAYLGVGQKADVSALAPEIVDVALEVAIVDGGAEVWKAAREKLSTTDDALVRRALLEALMAAPEPLVEQSRALLLDGTVRGGEMYYAVRALLLEPSTLTASWTWLTAHLDAVAGRMPDAVKGYLPNMAGRLCDAAKEPEIRAAFAPYLESFVGARRELDNAVERVRVCAAVADKQRAPLVRWLDKR
jgi:alanyl aminopeptidase